MPDTDESAHSQQHRAAGGEITVREPGEVDDEDGVFEIRMPIASTGDVRNENDDPLSREELEGFARQLSERSIGVFPAHGSDSTIADGRYSPFERLGNWHTGEFESRSENGDDGVLMATARMPDPDSLPDLGAYRQALGILKEQAKRGIDQDASIGWREDEDFPGGNDLMEASIVGIGADWRTNTNDDAAGVVTQAALDAGADKSDLLAKVRAAITEREGRPLGPEEDPNRFDDWEDCMSAMQESGHSEEEASRICGSFKAESEEADADNPDKEHDMTTDTDDDEQRDEQDAADDAETQDGDTEQVRQSAAEITDMAEDIIMGHTERAMDELREELEDMMGDGGENESDDEDDMDDEDDDEEQAADEPDAEQDTDPEDTQSADTEDDADDALSEEVRELRDELDELRANGVTADDVETPDPEEEQDADADDEAEAETDTRETAKDATQGLGDYR